MIFGRKSYEIFGGDLPDAELFVISRSVDLAGARVFHDVEQAVAAAHETGKTVFSAGGASIYRLTLSMADTMYLHPAFEFRVYERHRG